MTRRDLASPASRREAAPDTHAGSRLPEHSLVTLSSRFKLEDGRMLPSGAAGAIVGMWKDGRAYEVEFNKPFHAVVTIPRAKLKQARSSSG